ncbi:MAG: ABC transporter permease [Spirochaetia bacterium]|jgi:peptide/nickel transport system permease protein
MKKMLWYFVRKILVYTLVFFVALTVFYFVLQLAPGDPVLRYVREMESRYGYNTGTTESGAQLFRSQFGLDKPVPIRYLSFMKELLFHGNFGPSIVSYPVPAQVGVFQALPWSIGLLGVSVIISWILGMGLGTVLGWRRGKALDSIATPFAITLAQMPQYLMAILLSMIFVYVIAVFPAGGAYSAALKRSWSLPFIGSLIYHALLPSLSMVIVGVLGWSLGQRAMVINLLGEDYMRLAEAKGLPRGRLINRYILRNTMLPQTTGLALSLGGVVNGYFLIEWIFRYPGIGSLFVNAIRTIDYNVLLCIVVIAMLMVLLANLIIEFLYPLIDPRIRRG